MSRPNSVLKSAAQLGALLESKSIFEGLSEKYLLNNLLKDPQPAATFPFVAIRDELERFRTKAYDKRIQRLQMQNTLKPRADTPAPSTAALELMGRPAVTSKDLDNFLRANGLHSAPPSEAQEHIDQGIIDLISASTPNNLRTLMQYLAKYWQVGLFDVKPSIFMARAHARALLARAIELHPATKYEGGGEQIGVPDIHKFQQFVDNFFKYLNVTRRPDDELDDLVLQLCAKAGSLKMSTALLAGKSHVDESTLKEFLATLSASKPSPESLNPVRLLLLNSQTGPASVDFLLRHVETPDHILAVLENVDLSSQKVEVYEQCQTSIIQAALDTGDKNDRLALMFGLLDRIRKVVPLDCATLDVAVEAAMMADNVSAVSQLLSQVSHSSEAIERAKKYVHM